MHKFELEVNHVSAEKTGLPFQKQSAKEIIQLAIAVGLTELKLNDKIVVKFDGQLLVYKDSAG